ncbi:MAG: aryl-sulfate sulfotransferase [Chloroflexota bacterium]
MAFLLTFSSHSHIYAVHDDGPQISPAQTTPILSTNQFVTIDDPLPPITVTTFIPELVGEGYIFITPNMLRNYNEFPYMMMVDNYGEVIFFRQTFSHPRDFKVQLGNRLTYVEEDLGAHYIFDNTYQRLERVEAPEEHRLDFHDMRLLPNNHMLILTYQLLPVDMSALVEDGDPNANLIECSVFELDAERNVIFEWSGRNHFNITDTIYGDIDSSWVDYLHCNTIVEDTDGHLLLSARNMNMVAKIHRQTGEVIWQLGGPNNDFTFVDGLSTGGETDEVGHAVHSIGRGVYATEQTRLAFSQQHDPQRVPNGNLLIFDNGTGAASYSRAIEYELDETNMVATLVWEYRNTPDTYGFIMGNAQRLPNGNTLIGWGASVQPAVTEVARDGTKVFELSLPKTMRNYRAFRFPWQGYPLTEPTVISTTITNPETGIYSTTLAYSWNGATEVDAYQIYGDLSDEAASSPTTYPTTLLKTTPKTGFETSTVITQPIMDADTPPSYRLVPITHDGVPLRPNYMADLSQSSIIADFHQDIVAESPIYVVDYVVELRNMGMVTATAGVMTVTTAITPAGPDTGEADVAISEIADLSCTQGVCEQLSDAGVETNASTGWAGTLSGFQPTNTSNYFPKPSAEQQTMTLGYTLRITPSSQSLSQPVPLTLQTSLLLDYRLLQDDFPDDIPVNISDIRYQPFTLTHQIRLNSTYQVFLPIFINQRP